ncbi:hypothetical protein C8F01DRAFT_1245289 [Mycena amicta]|nr:hypothetical protein C8F01DRAFT_1258948 [Mycena amicta]KAJ7071697.1 hypothetical protein C8F01DRAFT_1245289 [Mycena amicta]
MSETTKSDIKPTAPEEATADHQHKKHGIAGFVDKLVHPSHGHTQAEHASKDKEESKSKSAQNIPVAVPEKPSDGLAHLAPGGSGVDLSLSRRPHSAFVLATLFSPSSLLPSPSSSHTFPALLSPQLHASKASFNYQQVQAMQPTHQHQALKGFARQALAMAKKSIANFEPTHLQERNGGLPCTSMRVQTGE